jgi:2-polyprenyl-6-methoxyphenol hydroxylase-like FAD-dependent oxidoreductase
MTSCKRGHAVVLGAGMAGLLAARVLSDFYDSVSVIDRDSLPTTPRQRKGVPQGRHLHSCLSRGYQVLEELLPGLCDELVAAGARPMVDGDLSRIFTQIGGYQLNPPGKFADPAALVFYLASRPLLEFHVRRRVELLDNVEFLDGRDILGLQGLSGSVTGVRIAERDHGSESDVAADLVVDATGRASRTPTMLAEFGYDRPVEERAEANWAYCSQLLSVADEHVGAWMMLVDPGAGKPRGALLAYEHGTWILTIGRPVGGGDLPRDLLGMLSAAEEVMPAKIVAGLRHAQPLGEPAVFRNTAGVRRRYEHLDRFPRGLLVTGDAFCSPNPIYGQGMTLAALDAVALRDCLRAGEADLAGRFFRAAAGHVGPTWAMNQASERDASGSPRPRSLKGRVRAAVMRSIFAAAGRDIVLTERFLRVRNLVDPPGRLRDPAVLARVLAVNLRLIRSAKPQTSPQS